MLYYEYRLILFYLFNGVKIGYILSGSFHTETKILLSFIEILHFPKEVLV